MTSMFKRIQFQENSRIRHLKTNKYQRYNNCRQVHPLRHQYDYYLCYFKHNDLDEKVIDPNKIEAPTFDGHHNPWIFDMWIRDVNQFF
jgi:hypothetical protein